MRAARGGLLETVVDGVCGARKPYKAGDFIVLGRYRSI